MAKKSSGLLRRFGLPIPEVPQELADMTAGVIDGSPVRTSVMYGWRPHELKGPWSAVSLTALNATRFLVDPPQRIPFLLTDFRGAGN